MAIFCDRDCTHAYVVYCTMYIVLVLIFHASTLKRDLKGVFSNVLSYATTRSAQKMIVISVQVDWT